MDITRLPKLLTPPAWIALTAAIAGLLLLALPAQSQADPPSLTAHPSSVTLGRVNAYAPPPPTKITFTNESGIAQFVGFTQLPYPDFFIQDDQCTGVFVTPGASCDVYVQMRPDVFGPTYGFLDLASDNGFEEVLLTAIGETATLNPSNPEIGFTPAPWYFGSQYFSSSLFIADYGIDFGSAEITGPDASLFSINYDSCSNQQYDYGEFSCGFALNFNPTGPTGGPVSATLTFHSNAANDPVVIPLTAEALSGPDPQTDPSEIDFGAVEVGQSSLKRTVTVSNSGDFPMQIQQVFIVSGSSSSFPISDDSCTFQSVAPGGSCSFAVRFTPSRAGDRDATALIISNSPGSVRTVSLTGGGSPAPSGTPVITGTPRVGETLTCDVTDPTGEITRSWIAGGSVIGGARELRLSGSTRGERIECRVKISNELGSESFTSQPVGPVAERDLSKISGSELGRSVCRQLLLPPLGRGVRVSQSQPITPSSPLVVRSKKRIKLKLGSVTQAGKRLELYPRLLREEPSGSISVEKNGRSYGQTTIADCSFTASAVQGRGGGVRLQAASALSLKSLQLRTDRLSFLQREGRVYGSVSVRGAGGASQRFPLRGERVRSNGITVQVKGQRIVIKRLPEETGRVIIRLSERATRARSRSGGSAGSLKARGGLSHGGRVTATVRAQR